MKQSYPLITWAVLLVLSACKSANEKKQEQASQTQNTQVQPPLPVAAPLRIKDEVLHAVYDQYLQLSKAFVEGNATEAKLISNALEAGARELQGGGSIAASAAKITAATSLETQRSHFATLSNALTERIKNAEIENGEIYVDYCPMALDNKGANWLSSNTEIRNPYYGEEMLTCGEIKDTLK